MKTPRRRHQCPSTSALAQASWLLCRASHTRPHLRYPHRSQELVARTAAQQARHGLAPPDLVISSHAVHRHYTQLCQAAVAAATEHVIDDAHGGGVHQQILDLHNNRAQEALCGMSEVGRKDIDVISLGVWGVWGVCGGGGFCWIHELAACPLPECSPPPATNLATSLRSTPPHLQPCPVAAERLQVHFHPVDAAREVGCPVLVQVLLDAAQLLKALQRRPHTLPCQALFWGDGVVVRGRARQALPALLPRHDLDASQVGGTPGGGEGT